MVAVVLQICMRSYGAATLGCRQLITGLRQYGHLVCELVARSMMCSSCGRWLQHVLSSCWTGNPALARLRVLRLSSFLHPWKHQAGQGTGLLIRLDTSTVARCQKQPAGPSDAPQSRDEQLEDFRDPSHLQTYLLPEKMPTLEW